MQGIITIVKSVLDLDFAPLLPSHARASQTPAQTRHEQRVSEPVSQSLHHQPSPSPSSFPSALVVPTHYDQGRSCVDLLLRLLGGPGATEKRINSLPIVKIPAETDPEQPFGNPTLIYSQDICSICLEGFEVSNTVRVLNCHHVYHAVCVDIWLRRRPTCPVSCTLPYHHLGMFDISVYLLNITYHILFLFRLDA